MLTILLQTYHRGIDRPKVFSVQITFIFRNVLQASFTSKGILADKYLLQAVKEIVLKQLLVSCCLTISNLSLNVQARRGGS